MIYYLASAVLAFLVAFILTKALIPRLREVGITGKDENKQEPPDIPEMGGIAIVAGLCAGILLAIFFNSFLEFEFNLVFILGAMITVLIIAIIGISDDLLVLPQWLKAVLPLFAAIPLVAVKAAGSTVIGIPFIGMIDFGVIYIVALIPLAIAVCSNLTNMLAGFNGMEVGMGAVIFGTMSLIAIVNGSAEMAIIGVSMFGDLLAFLFFNFYPAKIFPGDVGNLSIGAVLASMVIIGNLETVGVILIIPYVVDFFIKAANRFPHTRQTMKDGKLYPKGKIMGLVHVIMRKGITERNLVLTFIAIEAVFAVTALALYL